MKRTTVTFFSRKTALPNSRVTSSRDVLPHLADLREIDREVFVVLVLNARNAVLAKELISVGTTASSLIHPAQIFKPAILAGSVAIVVAHNHPSGDVTPSVEDDAVTKRLVAAGEILGIKVLDHIIVAGEHDFFSYSESRPKHLTPETRS